MKKLNTQKALNSYLQEYTIGDHDQRPWGEYLVIDVGYNQGNGEFCEKIITVNPGNILSLQSHKLRNEVWTVQAGILTVIIDDKQYVLQEKESIHIPTGAIHCMANAGNKPCHVHERQEGICREEDIIRYADAYGRGIKIPQDLRTKKSMLLYYELLLKLKKQPKQRIFSEL